MNLPKSKTQGAPSQCGLDFISISSHRRSILIDIPFHRTPLSSIYPPSTLPPDGTLRFRSIAVPAVGDALLVWFQIEVHRMEFPSGLEAVEGAKQLWDWFGYWPSFHDAEVIEMHLSRSSTSRLAIHAWETTNRVNEKGFYEMTKHVVVEFVLKEISGLDLAGFNHQNVISSLDVEKVEEGFRLDLSPCYGIAGTIEAKEISINLVPGKPKDAHF